MRYDRLTLVLAATLGLAACGGGDGGGNIFGDNTRTAEDAPAVRATQSSNATVSNIGNRDWEVDAGSYDKTFDNKSGAQSLAPVTVYLEDGGRDRLRVDEDTFDFARFGTWLRTAETNGTGEVTQAGAFIVPTANLGEGGIPRTSTATYTGSVEGNYLTDSTGTGDTFTATGAERLTGDMTASADFENNTLDASLAVATASGGFSDTIAVTDLGINQDTNNGVRRGRFETDSAASTTGGFTGDFGGRFYDDNGGGIGGTFDMTDGTDRMIGAFAGVKDATTTP